MIHREGRKPLFITLILLTLLYFFIQKLHLPEWVSQFYLGFAIVLYFLVLQFFRNPKRSTTSNINEIIAPADGKIVIIEECIEREYLKDKRMLISIFMSPKATQQGTCCPSTDKPKLIICLALSYNPKL